MQQSSSTFTLHWKLILCTVYVTTLPTTIVAAVLSIQRNLKEKEPIITNFKIQITNSMEQSPSSEANSHSGNTEIPCLLWNLKVHYRVNKSPPLVPLSNSEAPCNILKQAVSFYSDKFLAPHPTPSWRTTSCWMPAIAHSICLQLPSISQGHL
jgi:hypothetical protein